MASYPTNTVSGIGWNFDNSYGQFPDSFYTRLEPVSVTAPTIAISNHALAESLGLNLAGLSDAEAAQLFSGNTLPGGADPLAQAYAGHQFGHFAILGDGRAVLLGEQLTPNGQRFDIQLKGSGRTPYSRGGDGRAALAPMLREYIISEAMHALGIPTTRGLAVVTTGDQVFRETALPGAILTRVATSHLRVGTFQYVASRQDLAELKHLADYTIARHFPEAAESDQPYLALLDAVMERQASLVAAWMGVGFIHGVMNTDNMAISGETIDYGPCAFMDAYDPQTVFSSIDHQGRYAYKNQPHSAHWNLARFAETLLPLLDADTKEATRLAEEAIESFGDLFQRHWLAVMRKKLGLFNDEAEDGALIGALLQWMQRTKADYTNSFRTLAAKNLLEQPAFQDQEFLEWHANWQKRLSRNPKPLKSARSLMRAASPAIIPRNHRVEAALAAANDQADFSVMHRLLAALENPFSDTEDYTEYQKPPPPSEQAYQTFCGT
jgi:serine/tyrosine/threonine adenylyltransferase